MSTYLDKGVRGGIQRSPFNWNHALFGDLNVSLPVEFRHPEKFPTFDQFTNFTSEMLEKFPTRADEHIQKQSWLCGLHSLKFHFVGTLENMEEDSAKLREEILKFWGKEMPQVPRQKRAGHHTGADKKLKDFYSMDLLQKVGRIYSCDKEDALNSISYSPPNIDL